MSYSSAAEIFRQATCKLSLERGAEEERLLLVSSASAGPQTGLSGMRLTHMRYDQVMAPVQGPRSWSLVVVYDQLEHLATTDGLALLGRLRDFFSDHVVAHIAGSEPTAQEMLAVGYYVDPDWSGSGRLFRYSQEAFFEGRSWNSPEQWAHPHNFKRYRW